VTDKAAFSQEEWMRIKRAPAIVSEKARPEEAEAYRTWLRDAAREAADAAKEGGFLGFHAVRVSGRQDGIVMPAAEGGDTTRSRTATVRSRCRG
jgi:hypothetical protein